ncbi:MAG TPA: molybdopterin-binding protein, partial [Deltaproteobacteria bacterium]|nr:molybdopterin-binding protein [Deltaproteobacteria bacterium]
MTAGVLTLSDKGSQGLREDVSGAVIKEILTRHGIATGQYAVIPDDETTIADTLRQWCD